MGRGGQTHQPVAPSARGQRDPIEFLSVRTISDSGYKYTIPEQPLVRELAQQLGAAVGPPMRKGHPFSLQLDGAAVSLTAVESENEIRLQAIDAHPKNCGAGTKVVEAIKDYCAQTDKKLTIAMVANKSFFNRQRFPFLQDEYGDLVFYPDDPNPTHMF